MIASSKRLPIPAGMLTVLAALTAQNASAQLLPESFCKLPAQVGMQVLTTDNIVLALNNNGVVTSIRRIAGVDGNLIGMDLRPSDGPFGDLYGVSDTGKLYRFPANPASPRPAELVSNLFPRFAGGFQALADFNPVVARNANALRLIGSNDQNFAVLDRGGVLNSVVVQTPVSYVLTDPNVGVSPNLTAGAYDNNLVNLVSTTFYGIDYDLDMLVTVADRDSGGNSNTGGGQLKTIGPVIDTSGRLVNFAPNAGLDIFTQATTVEPRNTAIAVSGQTLYCIDLASVDPNLPPGSLQKILAMPAPIVFRPTQSVITGGLIDIAVVPLRPSVPAGQ